MKLPSFLHPISLAICLPLVLVSAHAAESQPSETGHPSEHAAAEGVAAESVAAEDLFTEGRLAEARAAALKFQNKASGAFLLGRLAYEEGEFEEACAWLDRAAQQRPEDPELRFWAGRAHGARARTETSRMRQASEARRAKRLFEATLGLDPKHLGARLALVRFHLDAPALVGGSRAEARRLAKDLTRRNVHAGHRAWAAIYEKEERWSEAAGAYRSAIQSGPGEEEPYLRLIWLHQRRKSFNHALRVASQLSKAIPESVLGFYEAGRTSAFSGLQLEEGKAALSRYLEHRPRPSEPPLSLAHFHLGMIHRHEGHNDLAGTQFRRALTLDPQLEEARRNLAEVGG